MNEELISKIKQSKYDKEKKWLYTFAKYLIEKAHDKDFTFHKLQNRINVCHNQSQGYFKNYYRDMNKKKKYERVTAQKERQSTKEHLEKQKKLAEEQRRIHKLYKTGKLSNSSSKIIERNLKK